jgi:hypothetical protein
MLDKFALRWEVRQEGNSFAIQIVQMPIVPNSHEIISNIRHSKGQSQNARSKNDNRYNLKTKRLVNIYIRTTSNISSSTLSSLMFKDQINLLDRMQQHRWQTHPTLTSEFILLATIVINLVTQPALPHVRAETGVIVPSSAEKIVLSLIAEDRGSCAAGSAVAAVVEDRLEV